MDLKSSAVCAYSLPLSVSKLPKLAFVNYAALKMGKWGIFEKEVVGQFLTLSVYMFSRQTASLTLSLQTMMEPMSVILMLFMVFCRNSVSKLEMTLSTREKHNILTRWNLSDLVLKNTKLLLFCLLWFIVVSRPCWVLHQDYYYSFRQTQVLCTPRAKCKKVVAPLFLYNYFLAVYF